MNVATNRTIDGGRERSAAVAERVSSSDHAQGIESCGPDEIDSEYDPRGESATDEHQQRAREGHREVSPVVTRGRHQRAQENVTDDSSAEASHHGERHYADEVESPSRHRGLRASESARERAHRFEDARVTRRHGRASPPTG